MTYDFSAWGVFFETTQIFVPGEWLRFTLVMDPSPQGTKCTCNAKVRCAR
jgi:hypothetical protein